MKQQDSKTIRTVDVNEVDKNCIKIQVEVKNWIENDQNIHFILFLREVRPYAR